MTPSKPTVGVVPWGRTAEGHSVELHRLTNSSGARIELVTYGATLKSVVVPELIFLSLKED